MIFDAHFHVIDPDYPLIPNHGYLPEAFTVDDYLAKIHDFKCVGGAVVSGSFQGFDQAYLTAALKKLGPSFVGVTNLPSSVSDNEILDLNQAGVRAVRFNLFRGGSEKISQIGNLAHRIYELAGWHIEFYIDSQTLDQYQKIFASLPKLSIDHLGLTKAGLPQLYHQVENGAHVKATGFMRVDFDVAPVLKAIYDINPDALMFGTDLPGTRASRQFSLDDLQIIHDSFDENAQTKILLDNAKQFYGLE